MDKLFNSATQAVDLSASWRLRPLSDSLSEGYFGWDNEIDPAHSNSERVEGIEPTPSRWQREILPLNYTRKVANLLIT